MQQLKAFNSEVIVVDDYSEQPVKVEKAVVIRNPTQLGSGESRNRGYRQAKRNWLLFLDDDLVPSPGLAHFVERLLPTLTSHDVIGFRIAGSNTIGQSTAKYRNTGVNRMLNILFGVDISPHTGPSRFVPSAMILRSELFAVLGGFDTRAYSGNGFREESDLQWRARKMGAKLTYIEDPYFLHLNVSGGHNKRRSENSIYYMRNQTIFALRSGRPAALVMIGTFCVFMLIKGFPISTLVRGIAKGVEAILQS